MRPIVNGYLDALDSALHRRGIRAPLLIHAVARLDDAGVLKVGPESAGADPGPACYGRGGSAPTVTDASLVLGYLDPARFGSGAV